MRINKAKTAVIFPGQGSQFVGMGAEFVAASPAAAEIMERAQAVSGFPLRRLCLEGPLAELTRVAVLQPAITAVNILCWQELRQAGVEADCFAGHSLGEYSALYAAGVLGLDDVLALVTARGALMEREGLRHQGAMLAVLGLTLAEVEAVLAGPGQQGGVVAANHNSERQIVISGTTAALQAAAALLTAGGAKTVPLKVSVANHSPLVAGAVPDFIAIMEKVAFQPPRCPLYFNVSAAPATDAAVMRDLMARQIAARVRWFEIVQAMLADGVRLFIEVGPKNVLSGLVKKIALPEQGCVVLQVDSPAGVDRLLQTLS